MIKAAIVAAAFPQEATPGESVRYQITLRNIGDEKGWLICSIAYFAEGAWQPTLGDWVELNSGQAHIYDLYLTMPSYDIDVIIDASHWDPVVNIAITDEQKGPYRLAVKEPVVQVGPVPRIMWHLPVAEAQAGSEVPYSAGVLNVGDQDGVFRLRAALFDTFYVRSFWTDPLGVKTGFLGDFAGTFPMPDFNVRVELQAEWLDPVGWVWRDGGDPVGYSIAVVRDEWPSLVMPAVMWDALSSGWCNIVAGEWFDESIFGIGLKIPPFSFTPGYWARDAIQWVIDRINSVIDGIRSLVVTVQEAWDTAWAAAEAVDGWFSSATSFISTFVGTWWTEAFESVIHAIGAAVGSLNDLLGGRITVLEDVVDTLTGLDLSWDNIAANIIDIIERVPPFDFVLDVVRTITRLGIEMLDELPDFFSNPAGWIFDKIDDWLNEEVE